MLKQLKSWVPFLLVAGFALAGTIVDQGRAGTEGAWPVSTVEGTSLDGGTVWSVGYFCNSRNQTVTSIGTTAASLTVGLSGRWYTRICNSLENTGTPNVKCRDDGTNPVMGVANAGEVLGVGDCVTYYTTAAIRCISNTAGTATTQSECQ